MRFLSCLILGSSLSFFALAAAGQPTALTPSGDDYQWLESALDPAASAWATAQSAQTVTKLGADPREIGVRQDLEKVLYSPTRLPSITVAHGQVENLWRDQTHPHGSWRLQSLADFAAGSSNWQTELDFDRLSAIEQTNWVWKASLCLEPAPHSLPDFNVARRWRCHRRA